MRKRVRRSPKKAGIKPPAFIPFGVEIERYKRAAFQPYPPEKLNYHLPWIRDFLQGLSHGEASVLTHPLHLNKNEILVRQRARLLARQIGMPIKDISLRL